MDCCVVVISLVLVKEPLAFVDHVVLLFVDVDGGSSVRARVGPRSAGLLPVMTTQR
jgi:hypothetical protein